jgi:hypothetical protein
MWMQMHRSSMLSITSARTTELVSNSLPAAFVEAIAVAAFAAYSMQHFGMQQRWMMAEGCCNRYGYYAATVTAAKSMLQLNRCRTDAASTLQHSIHCCKIDGNHAAS